MCLWRSWTPAPWKCSCAACSRGRVTARASAGSPSTLTDVWTVTIKVDFWTDPVHSFPWTFLIGQGKLSNHVWHWKAMHLCLRSSPSGDMCSSPLVGSNTACLLVQVSVRDLGWQDLPGKAGCHHGTPGKKNTSHHWLISKESDSIF